MLDHARLREGERGEDGYRVQRQQRSGVAAKHDDEQGAQCAQHENAVGKRQSLTAERELFGRVVVPREQRRQAWEIGEGSVRRQNENQYRGKVDHVVHRSLVEDRVGEQRDDRFFLAAG